MPEKENEPVFYIIDYGAKHLPYRAHDNDAGLDVFAPCTFYVKPHACVMIRCGFGVYMPEGFAAYMKPRGSLGLKGLIPVDNPVDSDYRGEVHAVIWNCSAETREIREGERFCQLVIAPVVTGFMPTINPVDVPWTERGAGNHGSTGR